MERPRLEIEIYQIVDDSVMKANRNDGTGWDWSWAGWQREWMDATPNRYAYRCLPLTIANQTGWWIKNPVGFTATWLGRSEPGTIQFHFDTAGEIWKEWINSQFGEGIITWNTPFLWRTKPEGSRLLICGPVNRFKANAHPLTAMIESDWMSMSFTMNWKLMKPNEPVRFELGEPLFQAIPIASNVGADLEAASVSYQRLMDVPEMTKAYNDWHLSRKDFHERKAKGDVKPDDWQKDYFHGRDATGREVAPNHMTKVKAPPVRLGNSERFLKLDDNPSDRPPPQRQPARAQAPAPAVVNDEWRRWIAENLLLGSTGETILHAMTTSGVGREEAVREINLAAQSPYLNGTAQLRNRLRKRDWLLGVYRKSNRLHPQAGAIERRHKLSRAEFLEDYYTTGRPVIITGMIDDWPALRKWDLDYFAERFSDREVEVQHGRTAGANYEIEREKFVARMTFGDYIAKVRDSGVTNDFYMTATNHSSNKTAMPELWDDIVQIPEYLDGRDPLSGFFWLGPAGTITPFHHDLTNNFMAQVIGRKRIKVTPSWDMPLMRNHFHVFSQIDGGKCPPAPLPKQDEPQVLECILCPGEVLYLPIGCLHYVEGLDISVTVSFTNFLFDNDFASFYSTYHGV